MCLPRQGGSGVLPSVRPLLRPSLPLPTKLLAATLAACLGCASPPRTDRRIPTPELIPGANTVVVADAAPAGCRSLGSTTGGRYYIEKGDWEYPGVSESYVKYARIEALDTAAAKGATHVVYDPPWTYRGQDGNRVEYVSAHMYLCEVVEPAAPSPGSPQARGCTKDTDCKGSRICENSTCVDPKPLGGAPK